MKSIAAIQEPNYRFYYFLNTIILIIGIASSVYVYKQIDSNEKTSLVERAESLTKLIPPESVRNLSGSEDDLAKPEYKEIKKSFMDIRAVNHSIRFIYIVGQRSDRSLFFYLDSEPTDSEDYSPPGQSYEEASEAMYQVFIDKKGSLDIAEDRWGKWISGYSPLLDDQGEVVALVGIDTPAEEHLLNTIIYSLLPLILTIIIMILVRFMHYARKRDFQFLQQRRGFLSMASHEIRTPLTGIRWASETLLSPTKPSEDMQRKLVFQIHESCIQLINRLNNILSATSLEAVSDTRFRPEEVPIKALIEEMVQSLTLSASERGVAFVIDDSITDKLKVACDKQNMRHVFLNVLSNALKYTRPASEITIAYDFYKDAHTFRITDHGTGISKDEQEKIFTGYYRSENATNSPQHGNGLGLYLAKTILDLHKGSIEVESSTQEGTTFKITIPNIH